MQCPAVETPSLFQGKEVGREEKEKEKGGKKKGEGNKTHR